MKKMHTVFIMLAVVSVFVLSFLIGRATALRSEKEGDKTKAPIYTGTVPRPVDKSDTEAEDKAASAKARVKKTEDKTDGDEKAEDTGEGEGNKKEENDLTPPVRMEFPCGTTVLKPYSESAVYSETMDDWRAHTGTDYSAPQGTPVLSAWDGIVSKVYEDKLWGHCVEINHGGVCTVYKNLEKKILVSEGQAVTTGQTIGSVGKSASLESREAPHLHFEILQGGIKINPETYVYN